MAGGGGLVLGYLEVKVLEPPFRKQDQVLRAGPGPSLQAVASSLTSTAPVARSPTLRSNSPCAPIRPIEQVDYPLLEVDEIVVKWTGLVSVVTKLGGCSGLD